MCCKLYKDKILIWQMTATTGTLLFMLETYISHNPQAVQGGYYLHQALQVSGSILLFVVVFVPSFAINILNNSTDVKPVNESTVFSVSGRKQSTSESDSLILSLTSAALGDLATTITTAGYTK
jgi:hypothetical protein